MILLIVRLRPRFALGLSDSDFKLLDFYLASSVIEVTEDPLQLHLDWIRLWPSSQDSLRMGESQNPKKSDYIHLFITNAWKK